MFCKSCALHGRPSAKRTARSSSKMAEFSQGLRRYVRSHTNLLQLPATCRRVRPAVAISPLVSRVANSPPTVVADFDELGWPTPERMQEANQRLEDAAKEFLKRDVPLAITPAKRAVMQLSAGAKEQTYQPKKSKLTRPLPPRATKTIARLPLSELTSPLLNQNRTKGGLDSSSLIKDSRRVSFHQDISDVERQWYLESDKDSWRVND